MISVSCAALAIALADPAASGPYQLTEDCSKAPAAMAFTVTAYHPRRMTIDLAGHKIVGIRFERGGGGVTLTNGTISAPLGGGMNLMRGSPLLYGLAAFSGARDIAAHKITFVDAKKAVAVDQSFNIGVTNSRCTGEVEDCLIASQTKGITFTHNWAGDLKHRPSQCTYPDGRIGYRIARRVCIADGGAWLDGWHGDIVQIRNATADVLVAHNWISTPGQGGGQMEARGDAPLARVVWRDNYIEAVTHHVSLFNCDDCLIARNTLKRFPKGPYPNKGDKFIPAVRAGNAKACENVSEANVGSGPC
jgi:hypothetical protein